MGFLNHDPVTSFGLSHKRTNYTAILNATQQQLGFDPQVLVNAGIILAALSTALIYVTTSLYSYASGICLSSVHISEDESLYTQVMEYMSAKHLSSKQFRSVKATTLARSPWNDEDNIQEMGSRFNVSKLISYRALINRAPILMTPFQSKHLFRHNSSWLYFRHSIHKANVVINQQSERGYITIQCFGRDVAPVQEFLKDAQLYSLQKNMSTTVIYRAIGNFRDQLRWHHVLGRPERDIRTVILDRAKKQALLGDINEYLHPHTRRWYSNHGIPYRRGYLFSGAPGTGKTSLTAALAGVFGLDIYVLSLLDPLLTEGQLNRLLSEVPNRCIVLLEDIDAAGLNRPGDIGQYSKKDAKKTKENDATAAVKEATGGPQMKPAADISLSGLLNAIDGVSSSEGRTLIMTTNSPDQLDKALIRPGRVDMHIAFELPGKDEMRELFLSMYRDMPGSDDLANTSKVDEKVKEKDGKSSSPDEKHGLPKDTDGMVDISDLEFLASDEMKEMAAKFAEALPEHQLSLAAIQGFLLRHKRSPRSACDEAAAWGEEALKGDD